MAVKLRPEVLRFAQDMERALRRNDHKHGWGLCPYSYLSGRLTDECRELRKAVRLNRPAEVRAEAADVANFAMMIAENLGD